MTFFARFRAFPKLTGLLPFVALACAFAAPPPIPQGETPEAKDARMAWWREARFGIFIHWGLYAQPAGVWQGNRIEGLGEWIMLDAKIPVADYAAIASRFNPVNFNADAWVRVAKEAGARYIVITAKHHDGFAMFDSDASDFNIVDATPFGRDPLKELAISCERHDMKLGFYYSQAQDWHHAGGSFLRGKSWDPAQEGSMDAYIDTVAVPQVRELLTNYGPVSVFWWDTPAGMTPERAARFHPLLQLQPRIVTNNRLGGGYLGDTETPENRVPATGYPRDWEACMTMNDTWGFKSWDHDWKSSEQLIRRFVEIVSKGGNLLLNIGPTALGEIPAESISRLRDIGRWLERNGDAIYGTTASPFRYLPWGRATRKGDNLYLHVFDWPADGTLRVPMRGQPRSVRLMNGSDAALSFKASPEGLIIEVPVEAPDKVVSVVVLEGVDKVEPFPPPPLRANSDGVFNLLSDEADLSGPGVRLGGNVELQLSHWQSRDDSASWNIHVSTPGEFEVSAIVQYSEKAVGARYLLSAGAAELSGVVEEPPSGSFVVRKLGRIRPAGPGAVRVEIRPVDLPGGEFLALRTLTLTPVK